MSTLANGFEVEGLRVMPPTGEVAGPGGVAKLDPKVMDVLVLMAENAGQVMLRDDLVARLWPRAVVTDDALTRCFYELRRELAHAGGSESYRELVETLPKRGYRLKAAVRPAGPAAVPAEPPRAAPRRAWLAFAALAAIVVAVAATYFFWKAPGRSGDSPAAATIHAIAVLPFLDMSAEKDQGYFSDGVTEEILNRLSQAKNLRVIARTSSFALDSATLDIPQIGARLNVGYVLEGSVRKSGDRVRITAQLIDVATNAHVWSRTFEDSVEDVFAVQDEIAASVASALQATLVGVSSEARAPASMEAYQSFLHGQYLYNRRLEGDVERSVEYFQDAIDRDPSYARAWAALAGACSLLAHGPKGLDEAWFARQEKAALKAVELDPNLAVAHARLAQVYWQTRRRDLGNSHFEKALALDPNDPLVLGYAANRAKREGNDDRTVELWRQIVEQDPLSPLNRGNYADILLAAGRLDEARIQFGKLFELNPDVAPEHMAQFILILTLQERHEEAQALIDSLPEGEYRDYALALQHRVPGRKADSDAALVRLRRQPGDNRAFMRLAEIYAFREMPDDAFAVLQQRRAALDRGEPSDRYQTLYFIEDLQASFILQALHADPRWSVLTAQPS